MMQTSTICSMIQTSYSHAPQKIYDISYRYIGFRINISVDLYILDNETAKTDSHLFCNKKDTKGFTVNFKLT